MNASTENKPQANRQIKEFIDDISPIFRGRQVFIADVGAHVGSTFAAFYQSQLKVNRACLFEANPRNFEKLQQCVEDLGATDRATCLQVAVSDKPGKVYLHDMQDMSRVIGTDPEVAETGDQQVFEVDAQPLDDFRTLFPDGHISILKVDVEGHESAAFKGAVGILSGHAAEVIYVEAGVDRDNPQQTHYREIEDMLLEHGYRLFKIYEQTMEWIDDRPLLRRMNMAFVSPVVANKYPYSILKELSWQDEELAKRNAELEETRGKLSKTLEELAALARAYNGLDEDGKSTAPAHRELASKLAAAEQRVKDLETSTSWRVTAPLRRVLDRLKR